MILKRTWRPEMSTAGRMSLIAIALGVLPWTPSVFSQTPTLPTSSPQAATTADATLAAPGENGVSSLQSKGSFRSLDTGVATSYPPSVAQSQQVPPGATSVQSIPFEERLARVEAMLEQLMRRLEAGDGRVTQPGASVLGETPSPLHVEGKLDPLNARKSQPAVSGKRGVYDYYHYFEGPKGGTEAERSGPNVARNWPSQQSAEKLADIQSKLVELDAEIGTLQVQLKKAQAQRELLLTQGQWMETPKGGAAGTAPAKGDPKAGSDSPPNQ